LKALLLPRRDEQDPGTGCRVEHGPLEARKKPIAAGVQVTGSAQLPGLLLEARVGSIVQVQVRQLVEPHAAGRRPPAQISTHPGGEPPVAGVVGQRLHRDPHHFESVGDIALPVQRVHPHAHSTLEAGLGHPQKIPLQAAVGEVLEELEGYQRAATPGERL
jgi:hypothetical protein